MKYSGLSDVIPRFVHDEAEWRRRRGDMKHKRCPHCSMRGTLIGHGRMWGYTTQVAVHRLPKGFRLLCSNRYRHRGCGRTVSVWFSWVVHRWRLATAELWEFVRGLLRSDACHTAGRAVSPGVSSATPYRWIARLRSAQMVLRSILHPLVPPQAAYPELPAAWMQPYDQLRLLTDENDPFRWLHERLQTPVFRHVHTPRLPG